MQSAFYKGSIARLLHALALTLALSVPALAQQFGGQQRIISIEFINQKLTDLGDPKALLPANEGLSLRELDSMDKEIDEISSQIYTYDFSKDTSQIDTAKATLLAAIDKLKNFDCSISVNQAESPVQDFNIAFDSIFRMYSLYDEPRPVSFNMSSGATNDPCSVLKEAISESKRVGDWTTAIENLKDAVKARQTDAETFNNLANKLITNLKIRRGLIQDQLNTSTAKSKISGSLWLIMIIIGLASILIILAVKLFSENIQMEWVASGQVIQFVTVMILLSVIMALGLSGILKEETLGTLLGGIGGYVLAQGVGRAAAHGAGKLKEADKPE